MVGVQVTGKRLGILGTDRVGQVVAKRARGFDIEIHYHDVHRLPPELEEGAVYHDNLIDMFPLCDFISIHCNATPQTTGMMNTERLNLLPDGAIYVNAARGAIYDDALIEALQSGKLWAAGIDAYNNEPNIDARFAELPNTFLMPHIGSATAEIRDDMGFRALDNLDAFFKGQEPGDRVA